MGFGAMWLKFMEGSVFSSSMSVIVNGSTMEDFKAEQCLRHGEPISPFLCFAGLT